MRGAGFLLERAAPTADKNRAMKHLSFPKLRSTLSILALTAALTPAIAADNPFIGRWALALPGGGAGWLGVEEKGGKLEGSSSGATEQEFEDFNLKLEVRVPAKGNSGVYLRGIYEVQAADRRGKPLDSHNMGGIYSRITPSVAAEKPAGEWQTVDLTLVDRHVTVILNGKKIIANQPLPGCTGGALTSAELRPGPIHLQGDHTSVDYRNIVLRPVVK